MTMVAMAIMMLMMPFFSCEVQHGSISILLLPLLIIIIITTITRRRRRRSRRRRRRRIMLTMPSSPSPFSS